MRLLKPREAKIARGKRASGEKRLVAEKALETPFAAFLERDASRLRRERSRRRTLFISIGIHVLAVVGIVAYSIFDVDELYGPSVEVRVMRADQLPPGVITPAPAPRKP